MSDNSRKTPLARSLESLAEGKARDAIQLLGQALPCSVVTTDGSFATVKFEVDAAPFTLPNVTVPIAGAEYVRLPIQAGDGGYVIPADARLAGISGVASGIVPKLDKPANLTALVFFPIANKSWFAVDPNWLVLYGPDGVKVQSVDGSVFLKVSSAGIEITGNVTVTGDLLINGNAKLGGASGTKKIVLDGDAVVAGHVVATSTKAEAK